VAASRRSRTGAETGLVHIDGHTDFRHPGNSAECASLAGEDLAAVVGLHWPAVSNVGGLGPYFNPLQTAHLGCRDNDEALAEVRNTLGLVIPAGELRAESASVVGQRVVDTLKPLPYWIHVDVDVLDPTVLTAVDSPDDGGLTVSELTQLLDSLLPGAIGIQFTVFDPDLDPDGRQATLLTDAIVSVLTR
jgi:arginase